MELSQDKTGERVQSLLMISHVKSVSSSGFSPKQKDKVLSILSISFDEFLINVVKIIKPKIITVKIIFFIFFRSYFQYQVDFGTFL